MSETQDAVRETMKAWVREDCATGLKMMLTPKGFDDLEARILAALAAAPDGDMITPPVPVVMSANWVCTNPNGVYQPPPDAEVLGHYERNGSVYPIYGSKRPPEPVGVTREAIEQIIHEVVDADYDGKLYYVTEAADRIIALAKTETPG